MLKYLDFPPTPSADANKVGAFDREQRITRVYVVPTSELPQDYDDGLSPHLYWRIWLALPQKNRFVVLDIVRRGICCGQLIAKTVDHPLPPLHRPLQLMPTANVTTIRDILKLMYDYALDCYAFEGTAGRGRRYWISSVLRRFETQGIVTAGSNTEVYNYFSRIAQVGPNVEVGGSVRPRSGKKVDHGAQSAWPIVAGHWLAPREVRPLAVIHRPRLPCKINGVGFNALQYPFHESVDVKEEDSHTRWFSSRAGDGIQASYHPPSRDDKLPTYPSSWSSQLLSPLPFAFASF